MNALNFWFEFGSTYTYLSVGRIRELAAREGIALVWRPFLLMPILRELGMNQGPFLPFPAKLSYMWRDLERRAERHGLPYRKPSHYPPETLHTARVATLASMEGWCQPFAEAAFKLHWVDDIPIGTPANLEQALIAAQQDPASALVRAQDDKVKSGLRLSTEAAKQLGLFGSPSFTVGDEVFWGDDRLEDALEFAKRQSGEHGA